MSKLMQQLLGRLYREENNGEGSDLPGAPAESSDASNDFWAELSNGVDAGADDNGESGEPASADVEGATEEGTQGEPSTPPTSSTSETPAATAETPTETPATPEAQPAAAQSTPPVAETLTPEQLAQRQADYQKWMEAEEARLTQQYAVSEDDAAALATEPETVLPKLAAKVHMQVMQNVMQSVQSMLPQAVQTLQQQSNVEKQSKDAFYKEWPELAAHEADVLRLGSIYRQANPGATPEQAIREIGALVMQTKGLTRQQKQQQNDPPAEKPHRPATAGGGGGQQRSEQPSEQKGSGGVNWGSFIDD